MANLNAGTTIGGYIAITVNNVHEYLENYIDEGEIGLEFKKQTFEEFIADNNITNLDQMLTTEDMGLYLTEGGITNPPVNLYGAITLPTELTKEHWDKQLVQLDVSSYLTKSPMSDKSMVLFINAEVAPIKKNVNVFCYHLATGVWYKMLSKDGKLTKEWIIDDEITRDYKSFTTVSTTMKAELDKKLSSSNNLSDVGSVVQAKRNLGITITDEIGDSSTLFASQKSVGIVNDKAVLNKQLIDGVDNRLVKVEVLSSTNKNTLDRLQEEKWDIQETIGSGSIIRKTEIDKLKETINKIDNTIVITGDVIEIYKDNIYQPIFEKKDATRLKVKDNIFIRVEGAVVDISNKTINLSNGDPGNDYVITIDKDGNLYTQKDPFETPAQIPSGRYILGGFFFSEIPINETISTGAFATSGNGMIWTQNDVDNIKGINKFSIWDLRFRADGFISSPLSVRYNTLSNHGMVFDNSTNRWYAIYHANSDVDKFGISRSGTDIASGTVTPKVPSAFGGNGTKKYDNLNWWTATELAKSQGSRLMWEFEFNSRAFGTTENKVAGGSGVTYPKTERIKGLTSRIGCEQVTGVQWYWGLDSSYMHDGSGWSYKDVTGGRGQVYTHGTYGLVKALFGGDRTSGPAGVGSRQVDWGLFPWYSYWALGAVATRDLLIL